MDIFVPHGVDILARAPVLFGAGERCDTDRLQPGPNGGSRGVARVNLKCLDEERDCCEAKVRFFVTVRTVAREVKA